MRRAFGALGLLLALAGGARAAEPDSGWVDHYRAARAAYAAGEFAASRDHMLRVREAVGEQPGVAYHLARADAQLGRRAESLELLSHYAASGMRRDFAADSAFVNLFADPAFQRLAEAARDNGRAVGSPQLLHRFSSNMLITEDVAHDARSGEYFVTSVATGAVLRVRPGLPEKRLEGLAPRGWGAFAIGLDPVRRWLWVTLAATPTCEGYAVADSGRSWITAWDLGKDKVVRTFEVPRDGLPHVLGDLCVSDKGEVFVTDSRQGALYRVAPGGTALEPLVRAGGLPGAQGPALAADGRRVYVAQYGEGLAMVDLASGAVRRMAFEPGIAVQGIDGLYALDARTLLAVQNGVDPQRLVLLTLAADGGSVAGWAPLVQGRDQVLEPNHGIRVGADFVYLHESGWDRVGANDVLARDDAAAAPELRRIPVR